MHLLLYIVLSVTMFSCSSLTQVKHTNMIDKLYQGGKLKELKNKINKNELLSEKKNKFLKSSELGIINFRQANYIKALNYFKIATGIADRLYTISTKKKIESFVLSDSNDNYYPNPFDVSLLKFYELFSHYNLCINTSSKKNRAHCSLIESSLRSWHAFIDNLNADLGGKAKFKGTILPDVMALIFHDYLARRSDRIKVKNFKKQININWKKRMGLYRSYNSKYKVYAEDYDKLHLKTDKEIFNKYISKSKRYNQIESFSKDTFNTYILVLRGRMKKKRGKKYSFPLNFLTIALPQSSKNDFVSVSKRLLSISYSTQPSISFELPEVPYSISDSSSVYKLVNTKSKEVTTGSSMLLINTSEILGRIIEEQAPGVKLKLGAKLAVKHMALLLASYHAYKSLKKNGPFFAHLAAASSYAIGNKAIAHFQIADTRSWMGVHEKVELIALKLEKGEYELDILGRKLKISYDGKNKKIVPLFL